MKTFDDINFRSRIPGIWEGTIAVGDGYRLNAVAGRGMYCSADGEQNDVNDFSCFEVSIIDNRGQYVTKQFVDDGKEDILGYQSKQQITKLIQKVDLIASAKKVQQLASIDRKLSAIGFNLKLFIWIFSVAVVSFILAIIGLMSAINSALEAGY